MTKNTLLLSTSAVTASLLIIGIVHAMQTSPLTQNSDYNMPSSPSFPTTGYVGTADIVLASDYYYDINTGDLTSSRDNKVIYTFPANQNPERFIGRPAFYIFSSLDGSNLIL